MLYGVQKQCAYQISWNKIEEINSYTKTEFYTCLILSETLGMPLLSSS